MCGRFLINEEALDAASSFAKLPAWEQLTLHLGMIYPSQESLVLKNTPSGITGELLPFGVQPEFLKQRLINARAETVFSKPMFRRAVKNDRCVVVCCGFYEWDADKTMIYFNESQTPALYLAGLILDDGFVILTTAANASTAPFHHRMPLILNQEQAMAWMTEPEQAQNLTKLVPPALNHFAAKRQNTLF